MTDDEIIISRKRFNELYESVVSFKDHINTMKTINELSGQDAKKNIISAIMYARKRLRVCEKASTEEEFYRFENEAESLIKIIELLGEEYP